MTPQTTLSENRPDIRIYSIGYGGRSFQELMQVAAAKDITKIVDVRTTPQSRWFSKRMLLEKLGSNYIGMPELGGKGFSRHQYAAWYGPARQETLTRLVTISRKSIICLLCAERNYESCHRYYFVARALKEDHSIEVIHL